VFSVCLVSFCDPPRGWSVNQRQIHKTPQNFVGLNPHSSVCPQFSCRGFCQKNDQIFLRKPPFAVGALRETIHFFCDAKSHTNTSIDLQMCCLLCLPIGYAYSPLQVFLMEVLVFGLCVKTHNSQKKNTLPRDWVRVSPLAMIEQRS